MKGIIVALALLLAAPPVQAFTQGTAEVVGIVLAVDDECSRYDADLPRLERYMASVLLRPQGRDKAAIATAKANARKQFLEAGRDSACDAAWRLFGDEGTIERKLIKRR
jgi:hypothetical protein